MVKSPCTDTHITAKISLTGKVSSFYSSTFDSLFFFLFEEHGNRLAACDTERICHHFHLNKKKLIIMHRENKDSE